MVDVFPENVILEILTWVPARDLVQSCRLVCLSWSRLIDSQALWRRKCHMDILWSRRLREHPPPDWQRFYQMRPLGRNFINIPRLKLTYDNRMSTLNTRNGSTGQNLLSIFRELERQVYPGSYTTSCGRKQVIDLLAEGLWEPFLDRQPDIMVTLRFVCLWNGGYYFKLRCRLLAADNETVIAEKIVQQNEDFVFRNYGSGVRYLVIQHSARQMLLFIDPNNIQMVKTRVMVVPPGASHEVIRRRTPPWP